MPDLLFPRMEVKSQCGNELKGEERGGKGGEGAKATRLCMYAFSRGKCLRQTEELFIDFVEEVKLREKG